MEERRREMEKGLQALVSSAAGTKAGRQEKRAAPPPSLGRPSLISMYSLYIPRMI